MADEKKQDEEAEKLAAALKEFPELKSLMAMSIPELRGLFYEEDTLNSQVYSTMVSFMLFEAVEREVSQITITPKGKMGLENELEVQYKIGNKFRGWPLIFPRRFYPELVSGFKKLAGLNPDPAAYGKQQGGAIMTITGRPYEVTIRTESTPEGDILEISGLERTVQEPQLRSKLYIPPTQTI